MIEFTNRFRKEAKKWRRSGQDLSILDELIREVTHQWPPSQKFEAHLLLGSYSGTWDIHLRKNLIVLARFNKNTVRFLRMGTHDDLKL